MPKEVLQTVIEVSVKLFNAFVIIVMDRHLKFISLHPNVVLSDITYSLHLYFHLVLNLLTLRINVLRAYYVPYKKSKRSSVKYYIMIILYRDKHFLLNKVILIIIKTTESFMNITDFNIIIVSTHKCNMQKLIQVVS